MTSARLAPAHAVFGLRTPNLGDDLQALTVATISPYVSTLINRERIGWRQVSEPHVFVMNFWFMSGGYRWAPHETIRPIFHGFCIGRDEVLKYRWVDYLRRHQPIGCRDQHSVELLRAKGIEAFWTGCMTLFLGRYVEPVPQERRKGVLFVDCAAGGGGTNSRPHKEQGRAANQHLSSLDPRRSVGSMGPHCRDLGSAALCRAGGDQAATCTGIALRRLPNPARADNFQSVERLTAFFLGTRIFIPCLKYGPGERGDQVCWDDILRPVAPPPEQEVHFAKLLERMKEVFGSVNEASRLHSRAVPNRFRIPNPGAGRDAGHGAHTIRHSRRRPPAAAMVGIASSIWRSRGSRAKASMCQSN